MWFDQVPSYSEQQIVDCSFIPNFGCMGGEPKHAFRYAKENGTSTFADYPYIDGLGACQYEEDDLKAFQIDDFKVFKYPLN